MVSDLNCGPLPSIKACDHCGISASIGRVHRDSVLLVADEDQ